MSGDNLADNSTIRDARPATHSRRGDEQEGTMMQLAQEGGEPQPGKVLYVARTHTAGGRENGMSRSSDGHLEVQLAVPGSARVGTNPEQLFAAGWSACFESAIALVARRMKVALPADPEIDAEVDLILTGGEYTIRARLNVSLPGLARDVAQALLDAADRTCPYSKATRGNIDVAITLV
jgi:Ohr subfamily peroxiredoxin